MDIPILGRNKAPKPMEEIEQEEIIKQMAKTMARIQRGLVAQQLIIGYMAKLLGGEVEIPDSAMLQDAVRIQMIKHPDKRYTVIMTEEFMNKAVERITKRAEDDEQRKEDGSGSGTILTMPRVRQKDNGDSTD